MQSWNLFFVDVETLFKMLQENPIFKTTKTYEDLGYIFTNKKDLPIDFRAFAPTLKSAAEKSGINELVTTHYLTDITKYSDKGSNGTSWTYRLINNVSNPHTRNQQMKDSLLEKLESIKYQFLLIFSPYIKYDKRKTATYTGI